MIHAMRAFLASERLGPTLTRTLAGSAGIRVIGMGFGLLVGVQLARGLGADGYGIYGLAMSILSLASIPAEFGLPQLLTREIAYAQVRDDLPSIRGIMNWANKTVLALSAAIAVVGLVAWTVLTRLDSVTLAWTLLAGLPLVPLIPLSNLRSAAMRGLQHIVTGQLPELVVRPALFSLLLLIASISSGPRLSPVLAMIVQALAATLTLCVVSAILHRLLPRSARIEPTSAKKTAWIGSAWPMALTEAIRVLLGNFSILILGFLSISSEVGVFRVATSVGVILTMPTSLMHVISAPLLSRLYANGDLERLREVLRAAAWIMLAGALLFCIPFIVAGSRILTIVFGADFATANVPLLFLMLGAVVSSAFGASVTLLNMTGYERRVTRAFILSLTILFLTSIPLIHVFGVAGAAIANATAIVSWNLILWRDAKRLLTLDTSIFS